MAATDSRESPMNTYQFDVILAGREDISDDFAEALFEAGCDDGTPCSSAGVAWVGFHREAASLESAIRSAVADVQKAGCLVARVQIESDSPLLASVRQ
jgi:hypothetical protein